MRAYVRPGLAAMIALGVLATGTRAQAQATKRATPPPTPPPAAAAAAAAPAARPTNLGQVLATVNNDKITKGNLVDFLSRYEIPAEPENQEQIYRDAIDTLINMKLVSEFLVRQRLPVPEDRVNAAVADLEKTLKADGSSLAQALVDSNKSINEVREEFANRIRWIDYVKQRGTDAELKRFADSHKDLLSGSQVRASHILLRADPKTTAAEKQQMRQKLMGIKADIAAKKYTFAEAANKYSEDPANSESGGGDIGYFGLSSGIVEEFGKVAFALKPGQISDPIETPYGLHLIMVTDRQDRPKVDFEVNKPMILNAYSAERQKEILMAQRKTAKIDIKPMPADLFPPEPPAQPGAAAPTPTGAPAPAGKAAIPGTTRPAAPGTTKPR